MNRTADGEVVSSGIITMKTMYNSQSSTGNYRNSPEALSLRGLQNGEYELLGVELGQRVLSHITLEDFDAAPALAEEDFMSEATYNQHVQDGTL